MFPYFASSMKKLTPDIVYLVVTAWKDLSGCESFFVLLIWKVYKEWLTHSIYPPILSVSHRAENILQTLLPTDYQIFTKAG